MSPAQSHLSALFTEAFRQLGRSRPVPEIEVRFYPYAGISHKIRLRSGRVYVRISDIFEKAPAEVHRALAYILVARLLAKRTPETHERVYRAYAYSPQVLRALDLARRQRGRKMVSSARGRVYDLDKLFHKLNRRHFDGELEKPVLTWSQRRTRRILGHHDAAHDTIVISKTLDDREVPEWFVEYVLYHEMLHIKHPARLIKGRRYYHTNAFRAEEQRFPHYEEAQRWLEMVALKRHVPRARAA
ncbi:MAG TPA: SprT-like domain-containing protein [Pyrinomonadaceae bacterium]|nr:SprT-like domain-containing protein [Pyrinomonadaceae bacterium]